MGGFPLNSGANKRSHFIVTVIGYISEINKKKL